LILKRYSNLFQNLWLHTFIDCNVQLEEEIIVDNYGNSFLCVGNFLGHYDNTYKDFAYNDFTYNINEFDIIYKWLYL
jgi:hypothetical protein